MDIPVGTVALVIRANLIDQDSAVVNLTGHSSVQFGLRPHQEAMALRNATVEDAANGIVSIVTLSAELEKVGTFRWAVIAVVGGRTIKTLVQTFEVVEWV